MDPPGYPPNLVGCGWMWMDVDGYPFTSTYLIGILRAFWWFREHIWAFKMVRRYLRGNQGHADVW